MIVPGDSNDGNDTHARPKRQRSSITKHPAHGRWCHGRRSLMDACSLGMSRIRSSSVPSVSGALPNLIVARTSSAPLPVRPRILRPRMSVPRNNPEFPVV